MKLGLAHLLVVFLIVTSCSSDHAIKPNEGNDNNPPDGDDDTVEDPGLPPLSDEELLDKVQQQTFKYFWDFAEPNSGMARERSQQEAYGGEARNIITTGGAGFGLASFPAAIERGWINKTEAINRLDKILDFLEQVPTYHGAFSHWYYGNSAQTRPFSDLDDGGDLVETAFLIQGLLINRNYFSTDNSEEEELRNRITAIYNSVEWSWYTQGQNTLYWHWSPNYDFQLDLQIKGWNEALIVYVLAAGSKDYPISKAVYENGWASNGGMVNLQKHYGHQLKLGPAYGGPLFLAQYSFIGLNPNGLTDQYADYEQQTKNHALINYDYCVSNPKQYKGYGKDSWGLTASDDYSGYEAHSPTNDTGVITPTAALSSFPYTPEKSMRAMHYFYEKRGKKLWGDYGFYDAFSEEREWYDDGYLAIDQGPIIAMIENYRTQLLWKLFMKDPDVKAGLAKLGFSY